MRPLRLPVALLTLCAALHGAPARADNTADESDIAFSQGNAAFAKRDYERALAAYFLSYRLVPNRNVLFNIARCYEALDRFDEAYRYWYDLVVDPNLGDDDRREVKQALAHLAPRVALLSVTSTPPGAELFVDREDLGSRGKTPQTIAVAPGAHTVIVTLEGHHPATAKVAAHKGREVKQALTLERVVGKVELTGTPAGAVIRESADGPALGTLPATLAFAPGQRLLVVQAPGYLAAQVLVDVKPDATVTAKAQLTERPRPTGKVIVTANRENALVRVDGKDSGFTPVVLTLPEGEHAIEVSSSEVLPFEKTVAVVADSEDRLAADLRYAPPKVQAASKTKLSVDQAPASVTVITREELQAFGYQTVAEAVQAVRGFFVTDDRIYNYLGLRGFAPAGDFNLRLLVLYDGHPITDVWAGQGFAERGFDVDLTEVDRIEIVRGPASLLFGTGAFFGVINVVPRERIAGGRYVEGVGGAGDANGVKARVTGSVGQERLSALLSAAGYFGQGQALTNLGEQGVVRGYDGERVLGASARAKLGDFTVLGKINQRRKQVPLALRAENPDAPGSDYMDARGFAELRFEHEWSRVSLFARASYDGSRFEGYYTSYDDAGQVKREFDPGGGDWFGAELRGIFTLFEGNRLTAAAEGQFQLVYQHPVGGVAEAYQRVLLSGTLLDEWQLAPWLFVQAGLRVDKYFDLPDLALSPRGAVVLKPYQRGVTKLVVGQAFRAPTIYELYYSLAGQQRRPDGLKPELITTFELEHSHDFTPELRATAGAYYNLIDRLVELKGEELPVPACGTDLSPAQCLVYGNSPRRLSALGAEAELRWQPGRFTLVDLTYSFVWLAGAPVEDLPAYPMHMASAKAMVPLKEGLVRLAAQVTYQSARRYTGGAMIGEALLVNLGFSGEYGPLRYYAGVRNLLDSRYLLPVANELGLGQVQQLGRTFWLEVAAGF